MGFLSKIIEGKMQNPPKLFDIYITKIICMIEECMYKEKTYLITLINK